MSNPLSPETWGNPSGLGAMGPAGPGYEEGNAVSYLNDGLGMQGAIPGGQDYTPIEKVELAAPSPHAPAPEKKVALPPQEPVEVPVEKTVALAPVEPPIEEALPTKFQPSTSSSKWGTAVKVGSCLLVAGIAAYYLWPEED